MQPIRYLANHLSRLATGDHYLFSSKDLAAILPATTPASFNSLISRAEKNGIVKRICRGLYLNPQTDFPAGLVLYHAAARLRAHEFTYLSLESVLSDAGVISQIPINWITLFSSGRTNTINCGTFGRIEFIHTDRKPTSVAPSLEYDPRCRLWRASVPLALQEMKLTHRNTDLIDWEMANEFV